MSDLFESVFGPGLAGPMMWLVAIAIVGLLLYVFMRVARRFAGGTFVAGGRSRRPRLAVMDAAAVDSRRRLVLVRRDDVEHLILIGGPTDIVVEQNIAPEGATRAAAPERPPAAPESAVDHPRPAPSPAPVRPPVAEPAAARPRQPEPARSLPRPPVRAEPAPYPAAQREAAEEARAPEVSLPETAAQRPVRPAPQVTAAPASGPARSDPALAARRQVLGNPGFVARPTEPQPRQETVRPAVPAAAAGAAAGAAAAAPAPSREPAPQAAAAPRVQPESELDDALMKELEIGLDEPAPADEQAATRSVDEEMTSLLSELSRERR